MVPSRPGEDPPRHEALRGTCVRSALVQLNPLGQAATERGACGRATGRDAAWALVGAIQCL
eukprot:9086113-Alexandrium_andersonii.AAC.1